MAAIGVGAAILLYLIFQILVVAAVSAVIATLVTLAVLRYRERRSRPVLSRPDPRTELLGMLDGLVDLNIRIREQILAADVTARLERIIDKLLELLEDINSRHPGHDLTWTVNQMAKSYLPKVANPYLSLSADDREGARTEILHSLDGLEAEVDNVAELVRGHKMGDFKAKAAFLRARFVRSV